MSRLQKASLIAGTAVVVFALLYPPSKTEYGRVTNHEVPDRATQACYVLAAVAGTGAAFFIFRKVGPSWIDGGTVEDVPVKRAA